MFSELNLTGEQLGSALDISESLYLQYDQGLEIQDLTALDIIRGIWRLTGI